MTLRTNKLPLLALLGAVLILNLVIVLVAHVGLDKLRMRHVREAEIRSQNIAQALDMTLSETIRKIDLSLETVVAELDQHASLSDADSLRRIRSLLHQQKTQLPETEAWSIVDAKGQVDFHSSTAGPANFTVEDREYFRRLKSDSQDRLYISKPILSRVSNERIVVFVRRFNYPGGDFRGIVVIPLGISHFNRMLSKYDLGVNGTAALYFGDFDPLTRIVRSVDGDVSARLDPPNHAAIGETVRRLGQAGTYQAPSLFDGIDRISSYRQLNDIDLYVVAGVSSNEFLEEWRAFAYKLWFVVGVFLLAMNGLVYFLAVLWLRQQRHAERLVASLKDLEQRDHALLAAQEAGNLGTYTIDLSDGSWIGSDKLHEIFAIDRSYPHTLEGWSARIHPDDRPGIDHHFYEEVIKGGAKFDHEYRIVISTSEPVRWVHGLGVIKLDANGQPASISGTITDITVRKNAEERLKLAQEVFLSATEGILVTDKNGIILETNPAFTEITGYANEEAKGNAPIILHPRNQDMADYDLVWQSVQEKGRWEGDVINQRKDGSLYTLHARIFAIYDSTGAVSRYCGVISDITTLKETQERLKFVALHDELTGLANRTLLTDRMFRALSDAKHRDAELLAVCHLDIDRFADINDAWGAEVGDRLLIEVARRLTFSLRTGDTVARLGGDEFVVVLSGLKTEASVKSAISRMIHNATRRLQIGEAEIALTISAGVTIYPYDPANEPDVLIRHADQALYEAKRGGKNAMRFFDPGVEERLRANQEIHDCLLEALVRDELCVHFQPKVNLRTGEISGMEALVRWNHPEKGLLSPGEFLPAIEATDLTLPFGEWILHHSIRQRQRWLAAGFDIPISVNIFSRHLQRPDFVERLGIILDAYPDFNPERLELEIVETTALEDIQRASKCIEGCKKYGVQFALDDFGTGFSSLTYLRQLAAATVKIDRSFVRDILDNSADHALVRGIIGMAHSMGRGVVAEGVESIEHGNVLRRYGCNHAQGYGIARPMPGDAVVTWVGNWKCPVDWLEETTSVESTPSG